MLRMTKRQKTVKALLNCFQEKDNKLKKKAFHVDRSFKHDELLSLGPAARTIFEQSISGFVEKERDAMQEVERRQDWQRFARMGTRLKQFGRKQDHSKTVYLLDHPKKQQTLSIETKMESKKIFIERKYNTQLSFQLHSIIQAKQIEDARGKVMRHMNSAQQSPLVNELLKLTRNNKHQSRSQHRLMKTKTNKFRHSSPSKKFLHQHSQLFLDWPNTNPHSPTSNSSPTKNSSKQVCQKVEPIKQHNLILVLI